MARPEPRSTLAASPTQTDDLKVGEGRFPRVLLWEWGIYAKQAKLKMSPVLGKRSLAGSCSPQE